MPHASRLAAAIACALTLPLAACASRPGAASGSGGATAPTTAPAAAPARPVVAAAPARPVAASAPTPVAGPIPFDARDQTIEEARRASGGRPVAMYFLAGWCGFCRKMEARTLSDRDVQGAMAGWYSVAVNPDSPAGRRLADTYTSGAFPTTVLFDAGGNVKQRLVGARDPAEFAAALRANR